LLKNPLADPYILGTSSGASIGVIAAFALRAKFPQIFGYSSLPFYCLVFVFSFLATNASYLIARTEKQVQIVNLLLKCRHPCSEVVMLSDFTGQFCQFGLGDCLCHCRGLLSLFGGYQTGDYDTCQR
jgi:hypothetical protein